MASLLGLGTTSSSLLGVAIGLFIPFTKRPLACLLAFAAGSLISALAIELAYEGALTLHHQGFDARPAWAFVSAGFAAGAITYYSASLFLEKKGAAVRYVTSFANMPWRANRWIRTGELSCWRHAISCAICRLSRSSRFCRVFATVSSRQVKFCSRPETPVMPSTSSPAARWRS
jgi:hypothetical protein